MICGYIPVLQIHNLSYLSLNLNFCFDWFWIFFIPAYWITSRTDAWFPAGFMDVTQIEKTGENFHLIYDVKGCYKLCFVREIKTGPKNVPYLHAFDGRTIRYSVLIVKANCFSAKRTCPACQTISSTPKPNRDHALEAFSDTVDLINETIVQCIVDENCV